MVQLPHGSDVERVAHSVPDCSGVLALSQAPNDASNSSLTAMAAGECYSIISPESNMHSGCLRLLAALLERALQVAQPGQVEAHDVLEALRARRKSALEPDQGRARSRRRHQLRVVQPHQQRRRPGDQLHLCMSAGHRAFSGFQGFQGRYPCPKCQCPSAACETRAFRWSCGPRTAQPLHAGVACMPQKRGRKGPGRWDVCMLKRDDETTCDNDTCGS